MSEPLWWLSWRRPGEGGPETEYIDPADLKG